MVSLQFQAEHVYSIAPTEGVDNREIPVVCVNGEHNEELRCAFKLHDEAQSAFDIDVTWGWSECMTMVALTFRYKKPCELELTILFNVANHCEIIDFILLGNRVIIALTDSGLVESLIKSPKVMTEVPPSAKFSTWNELYIKTIQNRYENEEGIDSNESEQLALKGINILRESWFSLDYHNRIRLNSNA